MQVHIIATCDESWTLIIEIPTRFGPHAFVASRPQAATLPDWCAFAEGVHGFRCLGLDDAEVFEICDDLAHVGSNKGEWIIPVTDLRAPLMRALASAVERGLSFKPSDESWLDEITLARLEVY